jgi:hypothetical protein
LWDTRLKEYTTGTPHELTDRLFVVRRAFRVNDALPTECASAKATRWQWQHGGWLLVDRVAGRVSQLNLPEFNPFYSTASWYRDYIAYCGVSENGKKLYAVVAQVGRRKPILKKDAGEPAGTDDPDSECPPPVWERTPMRVTFQPDDDQKLVFSIRSRVVDVVNDAEEQKTSRSLWRDGRPRPSTTTHMGTAALKTARSGNCDLNLPQLQPQEAPPPRSESRFWRSSPAPPKPR